MNICATEYNLTDDEYILISNKWNRVEKLLKNVTTDLKDNKLYPVYMRGFNENYLKELNRELQELSLISNLINGYREIQIPICDDCNVKE